MVIKIDINYKINIDKREMKYYNKSNIEIFTYEDYLAYMNYIKKSNEKEEIHVNMLQEEISEYFYTEGSFEEKNKKTNNEHDKIFRKILDIKSEAANFINDVLKPRKKVKAEEIEKYNSSLITKNLVNQECDIIYKIKDKNIFFLIEQQTKVDYTMPLRILEYEIAIIKSAQNYKEYGKKNYRVPKVYSIVLYTGKRKWNAKTYINEMQEQLEGVKVVEFARYNLIDINDVKEEQLLKEKTYLSKIMLLEKYNGKELTECLDKVISEIEENKKEYDNAGKEVLIILIEKILNRKIGEEKAKEIIKKLEGDEEKMLNVLESVDRENKAIFDNGMKAGIEKNAIEIIKEMLKMKMPINQISKITHYTEAKIKKIKDSNK